MDDHSNQKKKEISEIQLLPCSLRDYLLARKFSSKDVGRVIGFTGDVRSTVTDAEGSLLYKAAKLNVSVVLDLKYQSVGNKIFAYGTGYYLRNIENINYVFS